MAGQGTCRNPALIGKNDHIENISIKGNNTSSLFPVISWTWTSAPAQNIALVQALAPASLDMYTNIDL